jgi:hypothetical protein
VKFKVRTISRGRAEGSAVVSEKPVSFLGDVDPETGVIVAGDSDIKGETIKEKIFVFPTGRGSTVGTYVLLRMRKIGTAPLAIINKETEAIIAVGAIIANIPLVDMVEEEFFKAVSSGDKVIVDADGGYVELIKC